MSVARGRGRDGRRGATSVGGEVRVQKKGRIGGRWGGMEVMEQAAGWEKSSRKC